LELVRDPPEFVFDIVEISFWDHFFLAAVKTGEAADGVMTAFFVPNPTGDATALRSRFKTRSAKQLARKLPGDTLAQ